MAIFATGVYWNMRALTLREFSIKVKKFLTELSAAHIEFKKIQWPGNRRTQPATLEEDFSNLDNLILKHACDSEARYHAVDANDQPTWDTYGNFGFTMNFNTGKTAKAGGIEINISAGITEAKISNSVSITFPLPTNDSQHQFYTHAFQKQLLIKMISFWQPELARIIFTPFDKTVTEKRFTDVGWLTYIKNSNASAMRNNPDLIAAGIEMEPVSIGGTLFGIDRAMVSPDNETQVARAQLLRTKLMENHLIES